MTTTHSLAKEALQQVKQKAVDAGLAPSAVLEALLTWLLLEMNDDPEIADLKGLVQSELNALGSGGSFDIPRGGGHS